MCGEIISNVYIKQEITIENIAEETIPIKEIFLNLMAKISDKKSNKIID